MPSCSPLALLTLLCVRRLAGILHTTAKLWLTNLLTVKQCTKPLQHPASTLFGYCQDLSVLQHLCDAQEWRVSRSILVRKLFNSFFIHQSLISSSSMYTQAWDSSYATNRGQWRGPNHYTIANSYSASNATNSGDVSCPSDVAYLSANGAAFCSAYISYAPPVSTAISTVTPAVIISTSTETDYTTNTVYSTATSNVVQTVTLAQRALQSPASISTWSPSRISKVCSAVATGQTSTTAISTAATPYSTALTTQTLTSTLTVPTIAVVVSTVSVTAQPSNYIQSPGFEDSNTAWSFSKKSNTNTDTGEVYTSPDVAHTGNNYA